MFTIPHILTLNNDTYTSYNQIYPFGSSCDLGGPLFPDDIRKYPSQDSFSQILDIILILDRKRRSPICTLTQSAYRHRNRLQSIQGKFVLIGRTAQLRDSFIPFRNRSTDKSLHIRTDKTCKTTSNVNNLAGCEPSVAIITILSDSPTVFFLRDRKYGGRKIPGQGQRFSKFLMSKVRLDELENLRWSKLYPIPTERADMLTATIGVCKVGIYGTFGLERT